MDDYQNNFQKCVPFWPQKSVESFGGGSLKRQQQKKGNRPTKRTTFTPDQIALLEIEFTKNEYICKDRRSELARAIDLSECQVKTWFQNRRTKKRRQVPPKPEISKKQPDSQTVPEQFQYFIQSWNPQGMTPTTYNFDQQS